jgi:hypothetical protein
MVSTVSRVCGEMVTRPWSAIFSILLAAYSIEGALSGFVRQESADVAATWSATKSPASTTLYLDGVVHYRAVDGLPSRALTHDGAKSNGAGGSMG